MLAAASALAEHPSRIEKLFTYRENDSDGFYVFEFFILGEPAYVVVDDRLPVKSPDGINAQPFMARSSDNGAWWIAILEKAFAKYFKTYTDLNGNWVRVAFRAFTGMPVQ